MRKNCYELFWEIAMKEVYYNDVYSNPDKYITFEINPLFELIIGTNEFKNNIIKDYFKEPIDLIDLGCGSGVIGLTLENKISLLPAHAFS